MNGALKVALIGAAGWFVYEKFFTASASAAAPTTGTGTASAPVPVPVTTQAPAPAPPTPAPPPPAPPATTIPTVSGDGGPTGRALVAQNNGVDGNLNFDQWSYYYQKIRPDDPISPDLFGAIVQGCGGNHSANIKAAQFLECLNMGRIVRGLSGFRGFGAAPRRATMPPNYVPKGTPMMPRARCNYSLAVFGGRREPVDGVLY